VRSDLLVKGKFGEARIEVMWRSKTGRAEISNYTLKKLEAYGKNIGLLN
jgi:DNA (cytosine-5)-methyltransferase 1